MTSFVTLSLDTTPPEITLGKISGGARGQRLSIDFAISEGTATAALARQYVSYSMTVEDSTAYIDIPVNFNAGYYNIVISATDDVGNTATASKSIKIKGKAKVLGGGRRPIEHPPQRIQPPEPELIFEPAPEPIPPRDIEIDVETVVPVYVSCVRAAETAIPEEIPLDVEIAQPIEVEIPVIAQAARLIEIEVPVVVQCSRIVETLVPVSVACAKEVEQSFAVQRLPAPHYSQLLREDEEFLLGLL